MDASFFIAARLRTKGKIAMICIAVSFLVMIIAVAVASGYRHEVRSAISSISGDVLITSPYGNTLDAGRPVEASPAYLPYIEELDFVEAVNPVVKELGDVLWYVATIARYLDTPLSVVAEKNVEKAVSRKQRGKLHGEGDNR